MTGQTRLRINLNQREFEVEGSESFVEGFREEFRELLERFHEAPAPPLAPTASAPAENTQADDVTLQASSFGEFFMALPNGRTDVDQMLAAGYYVQAKSRDNCFTTAQASKQLLDHGIKVGNPSQCVKQSLLPKRVYAVTRGHYRVSKIGLDYLRNIMGDAFA